MLINVERVEIPVRDSIGFGYGRDAEGRSVCFAAEPRCLEDINEALDAGDEVEAEIERWQLVDG